MRRPASVIAQMMSAPQLLDRIGGTTNDQEDPQSDRRALRPVPLCVMPARRTPPPASHAVTGQDERDALARERARVMSRNNEPGPMGWTRDEHLLMECDSLLSLIRYRERTGLTAETIRDLDSLLPRLRKRTDEAVATYRAALDAEDGAP